MSKANDESIEQKLEDLRIQLEWFEGEDFSIDEALARFEKAEKLASEVENQLQEVKNRVTILKEKFNS